jgi:hypothetical protein
MRIRDAILGALHRCPQHRRALRGRHPDRGRSRAYSVRCGRKKNPEVAHALVEDPQSAREALAFVEFAGILAADRLVGEVMHEYVNDQRDAYHQSKALAAAAGFLNGLSIEEAVEEERKRFTERLGGMRR